MMFLTRKELKVLKQFLNSHPIYIRIRDTEHTHTSPVYLAQASFQPELE